MSERPTMHKRLPCMGPQRPERTPSYGFLWTGAHRSTSRTNTAKRPWCPPSAFFNMRARQPPNGVARAVYCATSAPSSGRRRVEALRELLAALGRLHVRFLGFAPFSQGLPGAHLGEPALEIR